MLSVRPPLFFFLLLGGAVITLACGSNPPRYIKSVTISPASADARNFPSGDVPFTASGYYTTSPSPVTPISATWGACHQNAPTTDVSVSSGGVAHCASGAAGTYTVWSFVVQQGPGACPLVVSACGGGCGVTGTAQLTCP